MFLRKRSGDVPGLFFLRRVLLRRGHWGGRGRNRGPEKVFSRSAFGGAGKGEGASGEFLSEGAGRACAARAEAFRHSVGRKAAKAERRVAGRAEKKGRWKPQCRTLPRQAVPAALRRAKISRLQNPPLAKKRCLRKSRRAKKPDGVSLARFAEGRTGGTGLCGACSAEPGKERGLQESSFPKARAVPAPRGRRRFGVRRQEGRKGGAERCRKGRKKGRWKPQCRTLPRQAVPAASMSGRAFCRASAEAQERSFAGAAFVGRNPAGEKRMPQRGGSRARKVVPRSISFRRRGVFPRGAYPSFSCGARAECFCIPAGCRF